MRKGVAAGEDMMKEEVEEDRMEGRTAGEDRMEGTTREDRIKGTAGDAGSEISYSAEVFS